ncbi:hypothetical protein JXA63_02310 [Candidatus Woesebacteria bacterium]|nr:hypothetical protein [Candidatus Woesebacteria bacterium]
MRDIWGNIARPDFLTGDVQTGIGPLLNTIMWTMIVIAGIYALINFIIAGYDFMSAGGDPGKVANAWSRIWQTIIGLIVSAGAFVIAAIVGWLVFGDWDFIINPVIPTPSP